MRSSPRTGLGLLLLAVVVAPAAVGQSASVRKVQVLVSKDAVEIEIEASARLVPQTQVLTGPDRLVVDFPNAVPGNQLRSKVVNRGEVTGVRVGLFQSSPPVTRVVLDLKTPQSYQVFPYGRTVIIKVTGAAQDASAPTEADDFPPVQRPGLVTASYTTGAEPVRAQVPSKRLEVTFRNGLLSIRANKASLSEVLFAVHQRTGAEVSVAAGAEQEPVVADLGPGPAPEVLAHLLNGSKFNFLILSAADNPQILEHVILSPRGEGGAQPLAPIQAGNEPSDETSQNAPVKAEQVQRNPPDPKTPPDDNTPD
jgi:hypothetical protein